MTEYGTEPRYTTIPDWYGLDRIAPGLFWIRERYYRRDYRCNMYLVKGKERNLLVDAGLGLGRLSSFLMAWARDPLLVLTHAHYDHIGSAWQFADRAIHAAEADLLAHPNRSDTYADLLLATADFTRLPWDGFNADDWQPVPAPANRILAEGDTIDLGDRTFEVLSTPGHSWGSICLWDAGSGLMISGDTVYDGELFDELPCSDKVAYAATMDRLRKLPVDTALPGHGPVLTGDRFRAIAQAYVDAHK